MFVSFDTNELRAEDADGLIALLQHFKSCIAPSFPPVVAAAAEPQPQVGENSGSVQPGSLLLSPGDATVNAAGAEAAPPNAAEDSAPAADVKSKRGPGRPRKEAAAPAPAPAVSAEQAAAVDDTASSPVPATMTPTIDSLREALQKFTGVKGMPAGIELLKKYGCSRISELAEIAAGKQIEFLAECAA